MTKQYHHIMRVERRYEDGSKKIDFHRDVSDCFEPDYWEGYYLRRDLVRDACCVNVFEGEEQ